MQPPTDRNFTIFDAMILLAATAVGFALIRATEANQGFPDFDLSTQAVVVAVIWHGIKLLIPMLVAWTLALPIIRLLPPRSPLPSVAKQPGMVPCIAVSVVLGIEGAWILIAHAVLDHPVATGYSIIPERIIEGNMSEVAFSITIAWLTLALGSWWHPEPNWIDRMGRGLGATWISAYLLINLCTLLFGRLVN